MLTNKETARKLAELMLELGAKLDNSVALVQATGTPDELASYRSAVGQIMGVMLIDIMNPLFASHPDLKPSELN